MEVGLLVMHAAILLLIFPICLHEVQCSIQKIEIDDDLTKEKKFEHSKSLNVTNQYFAPKTFSKPNGTHCILNLQKDFPKPNEPQPLYINPATNKLWEPNANGYMEVTSGAVIELFCSTSFANATATEVNERFIPKNTKTLKPICMAGKIFMWQEQKHELQEFVCTKPLDYTVERLDEKCAQQKAEKFRIGFNITGNRFIETMQICYDTATMRNHYTKYHLMPASVHFQQNVKRLQFSQAGYFDKHNMNFYYTQKNQWQRAYELYGGNNKTVKEIFNKKDLFLARGHLAAKADFIYANQQRSTFTFLNVAPQWQSFNGGQWANLENTVRQFVSKNQLSVDCYSGTWGTLKLRPPNTTNVEEQLFHLAKDENNNEILPVPLLFYRIIIDSKDPHRGIALIGVNNPFATQQEIQDNYTLCEDIKEHVPWLRYIRNKNLKKGYIYACNVVDFFNAVDILPKQLNYASELIT